MKNVMVEEWMATFVFAAVKEQYALSNSLEVECLETAAALQDIHTEESQWSAATVLQEARIHEGITNGFDKGFRMLAEAVEKRQPLEDLLEEFRQLMKDLPTSLPSGETVDGVKASFSMSGHYGQRFALSSMLLQLEALLMGAVSCRPMPEAVAS